MPDRRASTSCSTPADRGPISPVASDAVDADGCFHFEAGNSKAGDYLELYAPMDTLVVLSALQHPLDPNPQYAPKPVQLTWSRVESDGISVLCRTSRPENGRGFHNTERLYLA